MLEFIDSADDVVAVAVSHKLTSADLSAMMDRIEGAMARHDRIHVFVETRALDGIELSGFGAHAARALPMFRKLRHFGRVAVVADQAWVRAGSRIESALLPSVSYRIFVPGQRAEALAWVRGG
jgi:hypothetical protein